MTWSPHPSKTKITHSHQVIFFIFRDTTFLQTKTSNPQHINHHRKTSAQTHNTHIWEKNPLNRTLLNSSFFCHSHLHGDRKSITWPSYGYTNTASPFSSNIAWEPKHKHITNMHIWKGFFCFVRIFVLKSFTCWIIILFKKSFKDSNSARHVPELNVNAFL